MLAAVLGWVLPCQSTPSLPHKRPKGRFGLHAIVLTYVKHRVTTLLFDLVSLLMYQEKANL